MGRSARVTSIAAVQRFAAALRCFQDEASKALEGLDVEIRRAVDWIRRQQKEYWTRQLRCSEQQLQEAKLNLERCRMFKRIGHHEPSCIEEKRALEREKHRLRVCREKLEAVRHWSRAVDRAVFEYEGGVGQLARWLETDAERAIAVLGRIRRTLDAYVAGQPPPEDAVLLATLPPIDDRPGKASGEAPGEAPGEDSPRESGPPAEETPEAGAPNGRGHDSDEEAPP